MSKHGGKRRGSGRKRVHSPGVAHRIRETLNRRTPLHINFRYKTMIRNKTTFRLLKRAILNGRKAGLRIIHFSFQKNHVHLIIEADSNQVLTKGMRSVTVTMARGLKRGRIQAQRYHLHVLKSLRETKNAVHYVLFNEQKHEKGDSTAGEYSSLFTLENALELIKEYVSRTRKRVRIVKGEVWLPDKAGSHLLKLVSS